MCKHIQEECTNTRYMTATIDCIILVMKLKLSNLCIIESAYSVWFQNVLACLNSPVERTIFEKVTNGRVAPQTAYNSKLL